MRRKRIDRSGLGLKCVYHTHLESGHEPKRKGMAKHLFVGGRFDGERREVLPGVRAVKLPWGEPQGVTPRESMLAAPDMPLHYDEYRREQFVHRNKRVEDVFVEKGLTAAEGTDLLLGHWDTYGMEGNA